MFLNKILSKFFIAAKAFSFAIAEAGVEGSWKKKGRKAAGVHVSGETF